MKGEVMKVLEGIDRWSFQSFNLVRNFYENDYKSIDNLLENGISEIYKSYSEKLIVEFEQLFVKSFLDGDGTSLNYTTKNVFEF